MDDDARKQLLQFLPATYEISRLVFALINNNLDLFSSLLQNEELEIFHLIPLSRPHIDDIWIEKAKLAISCGYSVEQVAGAIHGYPLQVIVFSGNEIEKWKDWVIEFDKLIAHEDPQIRRVGEAGKTHARQSYERALARKRNEEVYGRY